MTYDSEERMFSFIATLIHFSFGMGAVDFCIFAGSSGIQADRLTEDLLVY